MNLNQVAVKDQPQAVVGILRQHGVVAAEAALQMIADQHGDKTVAKLIANLPALAIADIVREFDYTKPSIVGALLTPLQLRKVIERLLLLDGNIVETLCSVILQHDESTKRGNYFRELGKSEIGLTSLAVCFEVETLLLFVRTGKFVEEEDPVSAHDIKVGEWEDLLFSLRASAPSVFARVARLVNLAYSAQPQRDLHEELKSNVRRVFNGKVDMSDPYSMLL